MNIDEINKKRREESDKNWIPVPLGVSGFSGFSGSKLSDYENAKKTALVIEKWWFEEDWTAFPHIRVRTLILSAIEYSNKE